MEKVYKSILEEIEPNGAKLVAVSKRQPLEKLEQLYAMGQRIFGENRVQEFLQKRTLLPQDIQWHLIGHLQTNKVKSIIGKSSLIHSVDRLKLARKLNEESEAAGVTTNILLQIKIAAEDEKFGYDFDQLEKELKEDAYHKLNNLNICGVMGMATFTDDAKQVQKEFRSLKSYFDSLKEDHFSNSESFNEISMGMSGDYAMALAEGATIIRVGSKIFGHRTY